MKITILIETSKNTFFFLLYIKERNDTINIIIE